MAVEIDPIDDRIRKLCARAITAREHEVEAVLLELRAALREHAQSVRDMAAQSICSASSSKAAD
jgi:hypothetical protein